VAKSDLHSKAKQTLAEYEQFGYIPEGELNIEWNEMILAFEEGRIADFVDTSRRVQGLARILVSDHGKFVNIKDRLRTARRLVVSGEKDMASRLIRKTRKDLENSGREISPVRGFRG